MGLFSSLFKKKNAEPTRQQANERSAAEAAQRPMTGRSAAEAVQRQTSGISAEELYKQAAAYEMGDGVEKNYQRAFELYRQASDMGLMKATNVLGIFYKNGYYVEKNLEASFYYTKQAAEGGYPAAMTNLGAKYKLGSGCEQSTELAIFWYQEAQKRGNERAVYYLGDLYEKCGNYDSAFCSYNRGVREFGNGSCQVRLGRMLALDLAPEKNRAQGFDLLQDAAKKGITQAYTALGECYEHYRFYSDAWQWYYKAYQSGDQKAAENIARVKAIIDEEQNKPKNEELENREFWQRITDQFTPAENNKLKKLVLEIDQNGRLSEESNVRRKVLISDLPLTDRLKVGRLLQEHIYPEFNDWTIYKDTDLETPLEFFLRVSILELKDPADSRLMDNLMYCQDKRSKFTRERIDDINTLLPKLSLDDAEHLKKLMNPFVEEEERKEEEQRRRQQEREMNQAPYAAPAQPVNRAPYIAPIQPVYQPCFAKSLRNICTIGHCGHGKTMLASAITKTLALKGLAQYKSPTDIDYLPQERQLNKTINTAAFEYETEYNRYCHFDCPGHEDYTKNMIRGIAGADIAILVVSLSEGPMEQTREHITLAAQAGIRDLVVFMNKLDLVDDEELCELVEMEVRNMLNECNYPGEDMIVIQGSALKALNAPADLNDPAYGSILQLLDSIDRVFPTPDRDIQHPFYMAVDDVFSAPGGVITTGTVKRGQLSVNDTVEIVGLGKKRIKTACTSIETFHRPMQMAAAGECIGCYLPGVNQKEIRPGQILCQPGSVQTDTSIICDVHLLGWEEGGRNKPVFDGYSPQFHFGTTRVKGAFIAFGNDHREKMMLPGSDYKCRVEFEEPVVIYEGMKFVFREDCQTIGTGKVLEILR